MSKKEITQKFQIGEIVRHSTPTKKPFFQLTEIWDGSVPRSLVRFGDVVYKAEHLNDSKIPMFSWVYQKNLRHTMKNVAGDE